MQVLALQPVEGRHAFGRRQPIAFPGDPRVGRTLDYPFDTAAKNPASVTAFSTSNFRQRNHPVI